MQKGTIVLINQSLYKHLCVVGSQAPDTSVETAVLISSQHIKIATL